MTWLEPLALWGLAAALVPPLLHLIQRRRPPAVEFPPVRYLRQSEREAQRAVRLRHLLLMLLRMAAIVLIVVAAARPVVSLGPGPGAGHEPTAVALVLDNSLSSAAVSGGRRVLDDLLARAMETLREARPADAVWLIRADGVAQRLPPVELLDLLAGTTPDSRRMDLSEAVALAARLVRTSGYARAEVHVVSDLQRSAFGPPDRAAAGLPLIVYAPPDLPPPNRGVAAALPRPATWLAPDRAGPLPAGEGEVVVTLAGDPAAGRAVVSASVVAAARPNPPAGGPQRSQRAGGPPASALTRAFAAPGETATLRFPASRSGWLVGEATVEADELRADDSRPFVVRVVRPAAVAVDTAARVGRFLAEAIEVLVEAGRVRVGSPPEVVVAETPRSGVTVVLPPHDPLALGALNRALVVAGVGWQYGPEVAQEDTLVAPRLSALTGSRVLKRHRLLPTDAEPARAEARGVLASVGGEPWMVRADRTILLASRLVPEETTLPLSSLFVPFVEALLNRVSRGEEGVLTAAPGEPVSLPDRVGALVLGADSSRPVEGGSRITAPPTAGVFFLLAGPGRASWPAAGRAGEDTVGALVVAPDPRESDLRRATARTLARSFPGAHLAVLSGAEEYAGARFRGSGQGEIALWLLLVALGVMVAESAVAARGAARSGKG